jgi:hypothetical protein
MIATPEQEPAPTNAKKHGALLTLMQHLAADISPYQHANGFRWQHTACTDVNKFKDEAMTPSSRPQVFGFLQNKPPFVHILHSPAKFFELEAAVEHQGKVIAFIGDQLTTNHQHPLALLERNAWDWKTAPIVMDAMAAAAFSAAPASEKDLWKPVGLQSSPESLPCMIYLPTQVAAFALECPRMPWQVIQFVGTLI